MTWRFGRLLHDRTGGNHGCESWAEYEEADFDYLFAPYLARGEVSIFEGDPGDGKSYLVQMIGSKSCLTPTR
jgi:hypothetical protein